MIIESGIIVAAGLLFTFAKCTWAMRMRMLSAPLFMDMLIFVFLNILHWGSFSGVMVAATGALICSGMLSLGRYIYGHVDKNIYTPGVVNITPALIK